jgi:hypothetical protein
LNLGAKIAKKMETTFFLSKKSGLSENYVNLFSYSLIHFGHLGFSKPNRIEGMRKRGDKTG